MCAWPTARHAVRVGPGRLREHGRELGARRRGRSGDVLAVDRDARRLQRVEHLRRARGSSGGHARVEHLGEHEHVEEQAPRPRAARPRARRDRARRSAGRRGRRRSSGHGDVPHGGIGLAAASISRSTGSPPRRGRATTNSRCLRWRPWRGSSPSQTRPSAVKPTMSAPPRSTSAATSEPCPRVRDRRPHPEPRGVPRAAPALADARTARSRGRAPRRR